MSIFLIVDDSRHVQSMLKAVIEAENHNVVLADNGADALEKARNNPPDMVVSDIMMPVMDGFTLCRKWKNDDLLKNIPFVFYSSVYSDEKDKEDALNMADKLIHKSLEPEAFMKVMLDLINNTEHIRVMAGNQGLETEEESYKLYNDRLVRKLEEKTLQLEQEIASHRRTEEDCKLHQIELELQNEELLRAHKKLKASETALEESRNELRSIYDAITDLITVIRPDYRIISANKVVEKQFGKDLAGKICYEVYQSRNEICPDCATKKAVETKKPAFSFQPATAVSPPVEIYAFPILNEEGEVTAVVEYGKDITERKKAEEQLTTALKKAEDEQIKTAAILDAIGDAMSIQDTDFKVLYQNKRHRDLVGDRTGEYCYKAYQNRDCVCEECHLAMSFKDGVIHTVERSRTTDKGIMYSLNTASPLRDSTGKIIAGIEIVRDVTAQKQVEHALQESEKKFSKAFYYSPDLMTITRAADGTFVDVNESYIHALGYSRAELIGRCALDLGLWVQPEERTEIMKLLLEHKQCHNQEIQVRAKSGEIIQVLFSAEMIYLNEEPHLISMASNITELKKAEEQIRTLARFPDENLNPVLRVTEDGRVLYANRGSISLLKNWGCAVGQFLPDDWCTFVQDVFREGSIKNTEEKYANTVLSLIFVPVKGFGYVNIYGHDITEQKLAEAELMKHREQLEELVSARTSELAEANIRLREEIDDRKQAEELLLVSEEKYRALFEQAPDSVVLIDAVTGKFIAFNDTAHERLEYTREEFKNIGISDFEVIESGQDIVKHLENILKGGHDIFETKHKTKDGRLKDVLVSAKPFKSGENIYIQGIWTDITELRQTEKALQKSEDRYRRITDAITDYIYTVYMEEGRPGVTVHGEKCFSVTGYSREEFSSDPYLWINMVPEEDRDVVLKQAEDVLAGLSPEPVQHRIVRKDGGMLWIESMIVPNYDINGVLTSYDGLIRDITRRKRLEEQVVHAQKMDSIGTLAGGVAHDFNNTLTAIIGFSNILTRKVPEDSPLRFYVDQIQMAAESAAQLTSSLLAFGRKQKINPMPMNINVMIHKMEKLLSRIIREDIDFRTVLLDKSLNVLADFNQMQQVLMNLVTNSKDAMPEGGILVLTAESFTIDNPFVVSHGFGKPGQYALIAVSDTGTGIDEISKEKIFEPFFTTKEVDKGTGLGLSIVYGIIKQHKGYIDVESEPGKGTTVKIYLPLIKTGEDTGTKLYEDNVPGGGRETILLVEDNSMTRQFLVSELTESGYRIIVAEDGEEALYKFTELRDQIHIIITDVIMPKKGGKEVYAAIKRLQPDIKALFLSGYSEEMLRNEGSFIKGVHFMSKPVKPYDLLRKIREILDEN